MAKQQILEYEIHLTDATLVASLQGVTTGGIVGAVVLAPDTAAINYSAPLLLGATPFHAPCITSPWFAGNHYPRNVAIFDRKSGGWFGIPFLFGTTTHYIWRGRFVYAGPNVADAAAGGPGVIATRRFIDGFELPDLGEGGTGTVTGQSISRHASRHVQGFGLELWSSATLKIHIPTENGAPATDKTWERFYVRPHAYPAALTTFWQCHGSVQALTGIALLLTPSGQVACFEVDASNVFSFIASTNALPLETWTRIDLILRFGTGAGITIYFNGVQVLTANTVPASGMGTAGRQHADSRMGSPAVHTMSMDVDDWMQADWPDHMLNPTKSPGVDWLNGSAIVQVLPNGDDASRANWVGDWRNLLQTPVAGAGGALTSSTAAARLAVSTDAVQTVDGLIQGKGLVALNVAMFGSRAGAADGKLGYKFGVFPDVLTTVVQNTVNAWNNVLYRPAGLAAPVALTPILLLHEHNANATLGTIVALQAVAEVLGMFGPEDVVFGTVPAPDTIPAPLGPHNAPYPRTPWATKISVPQNPVIVHAGTYVGNGTGQDIPFRCPVSFLWIRPVTGDAGGVRWWTSLIGPHQGVAQNGQAHLMVQALIDPNFVAGGEDTQQQQTILRLAGASTQNNAVGVTYQYLAFCDPGYRFMLNACFVNPHGGANVVNNLVHPTFKPDAAFILPEVLGNTATPHLIYKGPGHAAASVQDVNGGESPNLFTFTGPGVITMQPGFFGTGAAQIGLCLIRKDDHSADVGVPRVVQITSFVGDGTTPRTIPLTPVSGRRPLWAMVIPHNAGAILRDPSHTGTTSSNAIGTPNAATGIIGGDIDGIIVGTAMNAVGVIHDVIVFPGDSVAGNAGWSINGEFAPVEPDSIPDSDAPGPWAAEPAEAGAGGGVVDPSAYTGPMPGLTDDIDPLCLPATMQAVNLALARIGVNQTIGNLSTDLTAEAYTARNVYAAAVEHTLRDFPWPFATRYANLTRVGTVAPNSDWLYSYRQPTDCIFERRLVVNRGGAVDPTSPPFQLAVDDQGGLIYSNVAPCVLEYTARPKCPHTRSEPLFRDAVAWRLALEMAPALTRMTDLIVKLEKDYEAAIEKARLVLRPGNPGEATPTATVDLTVAAKAANVRVVNRALVRIGARTIADLFADQSQSAAAARLIFEDELQSTLRAFPWSFATRYVTPALVAGTASVPVNGDWQYSYRLPDDVLYVRRHVTGARRAYDRLPPPFRVSQDATGKLLFTDEVTPTMEYTTRVEGAVLVADALFRDALAWRLAASLAPSLAQMVPETPEQIGRGPEDPQRMTRERPATGNSLRGRAAQYAWMKYEQCLVIAKVAALNEEQRDTTPDDADWIQGRN